MEFNEVVMSRRSIRDYQEKPVSDELLEQIITAASLAPSWKNSQTARFHIVKSPEMLSRFKVECLPEFNAKNVANAPVVIVVSFVKDRAGYDRNGSPTNELLNGWGIYDAGLASENLMLKASELGLGTLVMGIRDEKKIRLLLDIPANETIISVIGLGFGQTNMERPARKSFDDLCKTY